MALSSTTRKWLAPYFKQYKQASGWDSTDGATKERKGDFVDPDGKLSPEEDFANNIEFYLFERSTLKTRSPEILKWIDKILAKFLKLEKGCLDVE